MTTEDPFDPATLTSDHRYLWEAVVGTTSPIFTELYMFPYRFYINTTSDEAEMFRDTRRLLRMNMGSWRHCLLRAYDERQILKHLTADVVAFSAPGGIPDLAPYERGHPKRRAILVLAYQVNSAAENFHTALQHLVDRIALTLFWYFRHPTDNTRSGSHHRMLQQAFNRIHSRVAGTKAPRFFMDHLKRLSDDIVDVRNERIEHPDDAGDGFTFNISEQELDDGGYLRMFAVKARDPFAPPHQLKSPDELIAEVEHYISDVLVYMDQYEDKGIIRHVERNPSNPPTAPVQTRSASPPKD